MIVTSLKYGLLLGIAVILNVQIQTWLGFGLSSSVPLADLGLLIVAVIAAHHAFKKNERMSYIRGLVICIPIVLIMQLAQKSYLLFYINFIDTGWVQQVIEMRTAAMRNSGANAEAINSLTESLKSAFTVSRMMTRGILFGFLWGMIFSAVTTIFTTLFGNRKSTASED